MKRFASFKIFLCVVFLILLLVNSVAACELESDKYTIGPSGLPPDVAMLTATSLGGVCYDGYCDQVAFQEKTNGNWQSSSYELTNFAGKTYNWFSSPNPGIYEFRALCWYSDGVNWQGPATSNTIVITVTGDFSHKITASATEGGTISPVGVVSVSDGADQTFTITPNEGYAIADVKVDGISLGSLSTYTFNFVLADHTIEASFIRIIPLVADFDATPTSGSAPLKVTFTDKSTGDITSREWQYKLHSESTWTTFFLDDTQSYTFSEPGSYDVQLTVAGTGDPNTKLIENCITVEPLENLKLSLDYSGDIIDNNGNLPWSENADIKLHGVVLEGEAPSLTPVEGAEIYVDSYSNLKGTTDSNGEIDFWVPMKEGGQYAILAKKGSSTSKGTIIDITQGNVAHEPPHIITLSEMDLFAELLVVKTVIGISPWDPKQHYDWCSLLTQGLGFFVPASKTKNVLDCIGGLIAFKGAMDEYGYLPQVGDKNDIIAVQYNVEFTDDLGYNRAKDIVHVDLAATGLRLGGEQYWNRHFWCEPFTGDTWLPFNDHIDLLLNLHSPAVINVQFADGTYVGYNSASGEIEGTRLAFVSNVGDEPFTLFIPSAPQGSYKIDVIGTGSGPYTLTAQSIDQDLIEGPVVSITQLTEPGKIDKFDATLSESGVITIHPTNQPPVVNAGPDQTVIANTLVTLDGTGSTDPDNNLPLTYAWIIANKPSGSTAALSSTTASKPTFIPDIAGDYVFSLIVADSQGLASSTSDSVNITANVANQPPVPVKVKILPNPLNIASKGYFIAFVTLPKGYKAADVDSTSVQCQGVSALKLVRSKWFPQIFVGIFNREKMAGLPLGNNELTLTGIINKNGQKVGFSGSNTIKIISKVTNTKEPIDDVMKLSDDKVFSQFNPG